MYVSHVSHVQAPMMTDDVGVEDNACFAVFVGRRINVERTAGGGGKSEDRKLKIEEVPSTKWRRPCRGCQESCKIGPQLVWCVFVYVKKFDELE